MRPYTVSFSAHADADFDAILHYIAADSPVAAIHFIDRLEQRTIDFLSTTPNAGRRIGDVRYTAFSGYVVVYKVDDSTREVTVILVTEGHRNWQALIEERG